MAYPHAHKTVILLDHSSYFASSSQYSIDIDNARSKVGFIPLAPITKSLWTCNLEAVMEYCRIVYDLFGSERLVRLAYADVKTVPINSWSFKEQSILYLMSILAQHSSPEEGALDDESSLCRGLETAINYLCEVTQTQQEIVQSISQPLNTLPNKGRIICLTKLASIQYSKMLEECVLNAITEVNKRSEMNPNLLRMTHCELTLVHVVPCGSEINSNIVKSHQEVSPLLSSEVIVSQSGNLIANCLIELAIKHFDLGSTTITGIPMKEEQNASSSANYDVEILHSSLVHRELRQSGLADSSSIPSKEGLQIMTVALKWCTPKSNAVELHPCTVACRMTPVDVYSRPSTCLTNFLLAGRSVMLEQSRKTGTRAMSHMLSSHGNDLYIHSLITSRCALEDPPSISEGAGGRVTDYRINDFGRMSKDCRLVPTEPSGSDILAIMRAKRYLERVTKVWPMTIGESILFNLPQICNSLIKYLPLEKLTDDQLDECKKALSKLASMESKNESLPVLTGTSRIKGSKREDQYRHVWTEVERMLKVHADVSPNHQKVYLHYHDIRGTGSSLQTTMSDLKQPLAGSPVIIKLEKSESGVADTDSPESPPPPEKVARLGCEILIPGENEPQPSLFSWWTSKLKKLASTSRPDFAGRTEYGEKRADLYKHLKLTGGDSKDPIIMQ